MSYYAVENHGIVRTWGECQPLVHRKNLKFKKFKTQQEAQAFLDGIRSPGGLKRPLSDIPEFIETVNKRIKTNENENDFMNRVVSAYGDNSEMNDPVCFSMESICRSATAQDAFNEQQQTDKEADARLKEQSDREADASLLDFYTDGSHIKGTPRMGYGIYCKRTGRAYGLHQTVTPEWLALFLDHSTGIDWSKASNPTMELMAVVALLRLLLKYRDSIVQHCGKNAVITIYHDYTGVAEWILDRWKAKQPHIAVAVEEARRLYKQLTASFSVTFAWIRGHSGVAGNTYADMLANDESIAGLRPLEELFSFVK
jgi:ribonuclease HI